ncbi:MAG TPA: TlpA disulfide reductase family protein [Asticcacaulis sp.]|nr:TlpA disulfide reductase family protein [Asticcacaulis sp.]
MTEPRLNEDDKPMPSTESDNQGQPIADKAEEPKTRDVAKERKTTVRKMQRPPIAVIAVVAIVILALVGLVSWRLLAKSGDAAPGVDVAASNAPVAVQAKGPLAIYAKGALAKLVTSETPVVIEDISFIDRDQKPVKLSDFKGQVVVLNVWATWCAPCRFEMPTLAKLQEHYAGKGVKVLPLSVDTEDKFADVKSFMDVQQPLDVYADQEFQAPSKYKITGMPGTLILDKQGRQVARLDGEAKWDTPEVKALLDKLLSE